MNTTDGESAKNPEHTPKDFPAYVIITPVRDEVKYVRQTIRSVAEQTIRPAKWIVVDDGSTDGTSELLDSFTQSNDWATVVHRQNRGRRVAGGGVVQAFNEGYALVKNDHWQFVVKLDGDLSFAPDYFEKCFREFQLDERLGIAGGAVMSVVEGEVREDSPGDPPFHVRGATKIYRRACWQHVAPLLAAPGWDTIDEVKANRFGWRTRTLRDLHVIQHKPTGSADGQWRNWFKNGRANYVTGYDPMFMLAKSAKRAFASKPYFVESSALLAGFFSGYVNRLPQVEDRETIRYLRKEQRKRLLLRPSIYR